MRRPNFSSLLDSSSPDCRWSLPSMLQMEFHLLLDSSSPDCTWSLPSMMPTGANLATSADLWHPHLFWWYLNCFVVPELKPRCGWRPHFFLDTFLCPDPISPSPQKRSQDGTDPISPSAGKHPQNAPSPMFDVVTFENRCRFFTSCLVQQQ